jgi:ubiquinone/menaquinone biosynthesis C-methylase UbiE
MKSDIRPYLKEGYNFTDRGTYYEFPIQDASEALHANAYYFGNKQWAEEYLTYCHRDLHFKSRWKAAAGDWSDKAVIDIGCGPGNIFANWDEKPKVLIGVDVAPESLNFAGRQGYTPVLANASNLPFKSEIADIVTLNATLHHTDNMATVLKEAARLVKPGGTLITDHDPQLSAWDYKGAAKLLWDARVLYYRLIGRSFHKDVEQQKWALAAEIHHRAGDGVTEHLFDSELKPLGFDVNVYPHNHVLGEEIFEGKLGRAERKYRMGNLLSGRNPDTARSALSLMCVAKKPAVSR